MLTEIREGKTYIDGKLQEVKKEEIKNQYNTSNNMADSWSNNIVTMAAIMSIIN